MTKRSPGEGGDDSVDVDEVSGGEMCEEEAKFNAASYSPRIKEFLTKSSLTPADATFYLHKFDNPLGGEGKACVAKFSDGADPPDEDEVGRKYGSGRYQIVMFVPQSGNRKQIVRLWKFRCHQYYDTLMRESIAAPTINQQPVVVQQGGSMVEAIAMITGLLNVLIPMLRPPENVDMSKMANQNFTMFQDVMKKQMLSNIDLMANYQSAVAKMKNQTGDNNVKQIEQGDPDCGDTDGLSIIEQIAPYLQEWLPKLLSGGPQAKAVSTVVKGTELFKEIKKNRSTISALIKYLDEKNGPDDTNKILMALGMHRISNHKPRR